MDNNNMQNQDNGKPAQKRVRRRSPRGGEPLFISKAKIYAFAIAMVFFSIIGILIPLRPTVSEVEKRELAKFPSLTFSSFISGEYFSDISTWYADTYPFRENFIAFSNSLKNLYGIKGEQIIGDVETGDDVTQGTDTDHDIIPVIDPVTVDTTVTSSPDETSANPPESSTEPSETTTEITTGQTEVTTEPSTDTTSADTQEISAGEGEKIGGVYVVGDTIYELSYYVKSMSDRYGQAMSACADSLLGRANVYSVIAPKAFGFYLTDAQKQSLNLPDEKAMIDACYAAMNSNVKKVGVYSYLNTKKNEYIFFRTDHHWTALGAYYSYQCYCTVKGVAPQALSNWETVEFDGFLGTLYADAKQPSAAKKNPDTVIAYYPNGTNKITCWQKDKTILNWKIVSNVSNWSASSKYNTFIGGDQPYSEIVNPNKNDGSACVVIKDSFGNAFVPFLVDDYQYTYVVDFRYYQKYYNSGTLQDLVIAKNIQDVIFVNNITTVNSKALVPQIEKLVGITN